MNIDEIFNSKINENGDISFTSTSNRLLDILFMSEYYKNRLDCVSIGTSDKEKLFSMFMRDPRYGMGFRDLGRELMYQSGVDTENIIKCGRVDDIFYKIEDMDDDAFMSLATYLYKEICSGNELVKKWMPRYSSKRLMLARRFAKAFGMTKQQYGHFIKCTNTVENLLSRKTTNSIRFEHVPSKAMLKYYERFSNGEDTALRFKLYIDAVKEGKKDMKVTTTNVYDIYRNRGKIDCDLFFDKIEKISGNWIPIVDTSGSMASQDAIGKAMAIGHYLAKCSTYAPNKVITFSSRPQLIELGYPAKYIEYEDYNPIKDCGNSQYLRELSSMYTGDWSNTDFAAVMELLSKATELPEYLVVLSDMEFDSGSTMTKDAVEKFWKDNGYTTKIIWWNFNGRNQTVPETDKNGNIYISGYTPMLLKYLESGFDGTKFLDSLLANYCKKIS